MHFFYTEGNGNSYLLKISYSDLKKYLDLNLEIKTIVVCKSAIRSIKDRYPDLAGSGSLSAASCFHFPLTIENNYDDGATASVFTEISNPLSSVPRLQGKVHKSSVNGHLSIATILSNSLQQSGFPISSHALIQSGQLGLTFFQLDLKSRRVGVIISSLVTLPGTDHQVYANNDGDSVVLIILEGNYTDEQLIVLIFAILRLGATYMAVKKQDLAADNKAWKQLLALIEPILVITLIDPLDLPVTIRNELTIISREHFEDNDIEERNIDDDTNDSQASCDTSGTGNNGRSSKHIRPTTALSLIHKMRNALILQGSAFQPLLICSKVIWDLALEMRVNDQDLQVTPFKSGITLGLRPAFIFKCYDSSGKAQWFRLGHRAIRNRISWERMEFPFSTNEKCCLTFPLNDPRSLIQIFATFIHGKPLIIGGDEDITNGEYLLRTIGREKQIKRIELTPPRLHQLLEFADESGSESALWEIKTWIVSGTYFPPSLAKHFFHIVNSHNVTLIPTYGKAEVLWCATWNMFANMAEISKWTMDKGKKLSMGIPITNSNIVILDERKLKFCHFGNKGEICVAGSMVPTSGYCGAPVLGKNNTIFQTGDLGRIIQDRWGSKELLVETTVDSRIMLHGHLVDLDELTRQVNKESLIKDPFAFVCRRGRDTPTIVVAVSSKDPKKLSDIKGRVQVIEPLVSSCFNVNKIPVYEDGPVNMKELRAAFFKFLGKCPKKTWDSVLQSKTLKKLTVAATKNIQVICKAVAFSLGAPLNYVIANFEKSFWEIGGNPLTVKSCLCQERNLSIEDFVIAKRVYDLAKRVGLAEKDELRWSQDTHVVKRTFIYSKIVKPDRKDIHDILMSNLAHLLDQTDWKEVEQYASALLNTFEKALGSVALIAETREVVGVAFNYKASLKTHFMPPKIEEGIELFNYLLQSCRHMTKGIDNKHIAKSYLIALKSSTLNPILSVLVTRDLITESVKNAESCGCKGYLLCTVDPLVQEICCSLLGFEILVEVSLNSYMNKKLQKPFMSMDDHHLAGAYFKRLR